MDKIKSHLTSNSLSQAETREVSFLYFVDVKFMAHRKHNVSALQTSIS